MDLLLRICFLLICSFNRLICFDQFVFLILRICFYAFAVLTHWFVLCRFVNMKTNLFFLKHICGLGKQICCLSTSICFPPICFWTPKIPPADDPDGEASDGEASDGDTWEHRVIKNIVWWRRNGYAVETCLKDAAAGEESIERYLINETLIDMIRDSPNNPNLVMASSQQVAGAAAAAAATTAAVNT